MTAIISTTYDPKYIFYLPLVSWCWNKLGVSVHVIMPGRIIGWENFTQDHAVSKYIVNMKMDVTMDVFSAPEHKQPTYAQLSRLYAAAYNFDGEEMLITSDIDMFVFKIPEYISGITILGTDLVPEGQFPMCYASGRAKEWRRLMQTNWRSMQECLDDDLGYIECDNMRGNYWAFDQEKLWKLTKDEAIKLPRSNGQNQFAQNRIDRDDSFFLDRLSPDIIDYHAHRPGYTDDNFAKILSVIQYFYPNEDLTWMVDYKNEYQKLL